MTESNLPPLSILASKLASDQRITKSDWRTLTGLAARRNAKTGRCDPSLPTLSRDTGLPLRNQRRSLDHLEALGHIAIIPRTDKHGATISHQYDLLFMEGVRGIDGERETDGVRGNSAGGERQTSAGAVRGNSAGGVRGNSAPNIEGNTEDNTEGNSEVERDIISLGDYQKKDRPKPRPSKGTLCPEKFLPNKATYDWATAEGYTDDQIRNRAAAMADWSKSASASKGLKKDWNAAFKNWLRKDLADRGHPTTHRDYRGQLTKNQIAG